MRNFSWNNKAIAGVIDVGCGPIDGEFEISPDDDCHLDAMMNVTTRGLPGREISRDDRYHL